MRFYGLNIDEPLSRVHNTPAWDSSSIQRLHQLTNGQVFIREIPWQSADAPKVWRVTDAYFTDEDSQITRFRAFDEDGNPAPQAVFGINWPSVPHTISGGFDFKPEFGRHYYIPPVPEFPTFETGGYTVQVLDLDNPSEGLAFGSFKQGRQHQVLMVTFRLFDLGEGYPNDG